MNIAFDAAAVLGPMSKNRGIGNYTTSQIENIIQNDSKNNYFFFNCYENTDVFKDNCNKISRSFFYLGKNAIIANTDRTSKLYGELVKKYIKINKINIFYITSPFDGYLPVYQKEWFKNTKVVITVYDIIPYIFKKDYLKTKNVLNDYLKRLEQLRWCDLILVISESVKEDLVHYLKIPESKILCIWGGVDKQYCKLEINEIDRKKLFDKYGIKSKYIMCTGGDDERKNISGLISAYSLLPSNLKKEYQLVIVCKLSQIAIKKYTDLASKLGIRDNLVLTNFVPSDDLIKLYNMAYLMAFPSRYEGFGLPVVEAFACDTPVLTSNNSSLVQIAGDAAYLVDPFDNLSIKAGLYEALTDNNIIEKVKLGHKQLEKFQWEKVAVETILAFEKLGVEDKNISEYSSRGKIAFFTPLPPVQSGISDYSVDIINALSKYFKIDVFIESKNENNDIFNRNINIYNCNKYNFNDYFETIYQFGNSKYHFYMIEFIKKYSGLLVLHDYNLHGLVSYKRLYKDKVDIDGYINDLAEDYNEEAAKGYADIFLKSGNIDESVEINGFVTNYAKKIIVHSKLNKEKLLMKNISRNIKHINSYAKIESLPELISAKQKLGLDGKILLAAFGHIHETKRALPILKSINKLRIKYKNIKLIFCGKLDSSIENKFKQYIMDNNLSDIVSVTGYVEMEEFLSILDATDICLNLRYPYNGETSGSLMRILAKGKCALINDIGSFSELPDNVCLKLPNVACLTDSEEVNILSKQLDYLLLNKDKIKEYGENARTFAEKYLDLNIIANQYAEYILEDSDISITEEIISKVKDYIQRDVYTKYEILELAHTLAYIKGEQRE